jgi:hypothetical protein
MAPVLKSGEILGVVSYTDIVLGSIGESAPAAGGTDDE